MKISKSLIKAIAVAVTVATTVSACTKEKQPSPEDTEIKKQEGYNCLACGMGWLSVQSSEDFKSSEDFAFSIRIFREHSLLFEGNKFPYYFPNA